MEGQTLTAKIQQIIGAKRYIEMSKTNLALLFIDKWDNLPKP